MKIEIWSDVVCPFCYIGKRRLEQALQSFEHRDEVKIEWKSYQLNPGLKPVPGQSLNEYLAAQKGWSPEYTAEANRQVSEMAAQAGLDYHLEQCVVANTGDAHRLLQFAKTRGLADRLEEILFQAYFTQGLDVGAHPVLLDLAESAGFDRAETARVLESDAFLDAVEADAYDARQFGVRGVPFFIFDRKYGISGAQPLEVFSRTLKQTRDYTLSNPQ